MTDDDPALTEPIFALFARNDARPMPVTGRWKPNAHTAASLSIRHALEKLPGWKRIRKRSVGRFIATDSAGNPRRAGNGKWLYIQVAVAGDADIELLWTPPGANRPHVVMIEVKTGTGRLSTEQAEKKAALEDGGCIYIVAGNAADAFEAVMARRYG